MKEDFLEKADTSKFENKKENNIEYEKEKDGEVDVCGAEVNSSFKDLTEEEKSILKDAGLFVEKANKKLQEIGSFELEIIERVGAKLDDQEVKSTRLYKTIFAIKKFTRKMFYITGIEGLFNHIQKKTSEWSEQNYYKKILINLTCIMLLVILSSTTFAICNSTYNYYKHRKKVNSLYKLIIKKDVQLKSKALLLQDNIEFINNFKSPFFPKILKSTSSNIKEICSTSNYIVEKEMCRDLIILIGIKKNISKLSNKLNSIGIHISSAMSTTNALLKLQMAEKEKLTRLEKNEIVISRVESLIESLTVNRAKLEYFDKSKYPSSLGLNKHIDVAKLILKDKRECKANLIADRKAIHKDFSIKIKGIEKVLDESKSRIESCIKLEKYFKVRKETYSKLQSIEEYLTKIKKAKINIKVSKIKLKKIPKKFIGEIEKEKDFSNDILHFTTKRSEAEILVMKTNVTKAYAIVKKLKTRSLRNVYLDKASYLSKLKSVIKLGIVAQRRDIKKKSLVKTFSYKKSFHSKIEILTNHIKNEAKKLKLFSEKDYPKLKKSTINYNDTIIDFNEQMINVDRAIENDEIESAEELLASMPNDSMLVNIVDYLTKEANKIDDHILECIEIKKEIARLAKLNARLRTALLKINKYKKRIAKLDKLLGKQRTGNNYEKFPLKIITFKKDKDKLLKSLSSSTTRIKVFMKHDHDETDTLLKSVEDKVKSFDKKSISKYTKELNRIIRYNKKLYNFYTKKSEAKKYITILKERRGRVNEAIRSYKALRKEYRAFKESYCYKIDKRTKTLYKDAKEEVSHLKIIIKKAEQGYKSRLIYESIKYTKRLAITPGISRVNAFEAMLKKESNKIKENQKIKENPKYRNQILKERQRIKKLEKMRKKWRHSPGQWHNIVLNKIKQFNKESISNRLSSEIKKMGSTIKNYPDDISKIEEEIFMRSITERKISARKANTIRDKERILLTMQFLKTRKIKINIDKLNNTSVHNYVMLLRELQRIDREFSQKRVSIYSFVISF